MCSSKAKERATAGDLVEMVVCVCYPEMAGVFGRVLVGVTNERALGLRKLSAIDP